MQNVGGEYALAPAYDLLNTSLHIDGDDFGLNGGLSPEIEKSDVYERTGHPCRLDFMRFGDLIGLKEKRVEKNPKSIRRLPSACPYPHRQFLPKREDEAQLPAHNQGKAKTIYQ